MPTTREVEAKRLERRRRQTAKHYTPDRLSEPCAVCGLPMIDTLVNLGETTHPSCERGDI